MGITIRCGESTEIVQSVLEEIERKMPRVSWGAGQSPASWNPKTKDTSYGEHVAIFIDGYRLTYVKDSCEFIDSYVSLHHANDTIIYAEDFLSQGEFEEIENETDISFLFN